MLLHRRIAVTFISCFIITGTTFGQYSNFFQKGFEIGFKKGYCYNQNINCMPPLTPLPRLNESYDNYNAGYDRGFQVGLDLQRIEVLNAPSSAGKNYEYYYRQIPIIGHRNMYRL